MYAKFKYEPLPLGDISLDEKNPRIVSQTPVTSQDAIIAYLFEHEDLLSFVRRVAQGGKNKGAERPYVVKKGTKYVVVEGNTRIAAYKVLAGLLNAPAQYQGQIPIVSDDLKSSLLVVDCTIAPSRDSLLPVMAESHFGNGDKSKWGYLGSRKTIHDEFKSGKTIGQLSKAFGVSQTEITNYLLEYELYLQALSFTWTPLERSKLLNPNVAFNPPVRFLQTKGHKESIGLKFDRTNIAIEFENAEAKMKYQHLLRKLVINPAQGLGATALYMEVFKDYSPPAAPPSPPSPPQSGTPTTSAPPASGLPPPPPPAKKPGGAHLKGGALFNYPVKVHSTLIKQLMKEAADINARKLPACATFLIRNLLEALLKHIIEQSNANPQKKALSLEDCLNLCRGKTVPLGKDDQKILKDFDQHHLNYVNLGAHGNIVPNSDRVFQIRDLIDQFIKKNV
jgi:hypothetical protein